MTLAIFIAVVVILLATNATPTFKYDTRFIKAINDVVLLRKSNTCVILVVDNKIKFVSTEGDAPEKLAKLRGLIKNKSLEIIKSSFEPLSTTDVLEKLTEIGRDRSTFLVYFTAASQKQVKGSITTETTKPAGLVGNLLASLGLKVEEKGLLPEILSAVGANANEKDIKIVEFEY